MQSIKEKIVSIAYRVEIILFATVFVIALLYYNYTEAHEYFNRYSHINIPWYQKEAVASVIASYTFAVACSATFIFPVVFLIQLFISIWARMMNKKTVAKLILIVLLYFSCAFSAYLLYSISVHRNIKYHVELDALDAVGITENKMVETPLIFNESKTINGVTWAECNVDAFGTFAAAPEDYGCFYQWNRPKAWPSTGEAVTDWDYSDSPGNSWETANDPCPKGWRVPTHAEQVTLLDHDKVISEWTTLNGVVGRKFVDNTSGASIFFPAAGYLYYSKGMLSLQNSIGTYWSATSYSTGYVWYLYLYDSPVNQYYNLRSFGFSVRCVRKE